jgi:polysaccharide deacetylase family protein (PEP-CTERM system associated)
MCFANDLSVRPRSVENRLLVPLPSTIILSFDVEEHHRIEMAAGVAVTPEQRSGYTAQVAPVTQWLLEQLHERGIIATFFLVGEFARQNPDLVRAIHQAGHEVASHGWDHRRIVDMTPPLFREDLRRSVDTLQQIVGEPVLGYRAPTFSLVRRTAWAIDVLAEAGLVYDSSIYPVYHDLYGVPNAPSSPFRVRGREHMLLELPPASLRVGRHRLPAGGGGYFRLLPLAVTKATIRQSLRDGAPPVAMLYFHPWEFDPELTRLPLRGLGRFRTYVGLHRTRGRLQRLLKSTAGERFRTAASVAVDLRRLEAETPLLDFDLAGSESGRVP